MKKPIIILVAAVLFGCQTGLQRYSSEKYSFEYPGNYNINQLPELLTITGENGHIDIFEKDGVEKIHGFSSSGLDEFEAKYVPKEKLEKGPYNIWLFYPDNDQKTQEEIKEIFNSMKLN